MFIIIGADTVPTDSNIKSFIDGNITEIIGNELENILSEASYRILNLEVPLTNQGKPIIKQGQNLIAPTDAINGYKKLGVDLLTLANNHIYDQGLGGLESTIKTLDENDIDYTGVGSDCETSARPFVFDFAKKKIGVYACTEHEFSVATKDSPGANPFDPLRSFCHVKKLKERTDCVIVFYHGGKEHYRYPSPNLQQTCRCFVENGADFVIRQHSHCIGCEEKYIDGTIIYGQGNFVFDEGEEECWRTSLLVKIDENLDVSYIPLVKHDNGVRTVHGAEANIILDAFEQRSLEIKKQGFVQKKYDELAVKTVDNYLKAITGRKTFIQRVLNKLSNGKYFDMLLNRRFKQKEIIRIINYLECEAHRELLIDGLRIKYEMAK